MKPASALPILLLFIAAVARCNEIEVVLYGEALCPYTRAAVTDLIGPLSDGGLGGLTAFRYVAWGNARDTKDGVRCQHGPAECQLNRVINCAQHLSEGDQEWLPFVRCLEAKGLKEMEDAVERCAKRADMDGAEIQACAAGKLGDKLERQAAEETAALHPAHSYVPWITVDGVPLGEDDVNLYKYICVAVRGVKPEECFVPPDPKRLSCPLDAAGRSCPNDSGSILTRSTSKLGEAGERIDVS